MTVATNTPYDQYTASAGQTVFIYSFEIVEDTDLLVYQRLNTDPANDITDILNLITDYTVTGVGNENGGTIILNSGAALNDIVTIKQNVPVGRDTAFTPGGILKAQDLNSEFDNQTLIEQVTRFNEQNRMLRYWNSEIVVEFVDTILPRLEANQIWAMNPTRTQIIPYDVPDGGGLAPADATYLLQTANANLPNAQAMDQLASGLVINNTSNGVQITRVLAAVANQLEITDPSGIGGNPTYGFAANAMFPGTEGLGIVFGTTAQRPVTPVGTNLRFNTDLILLEYWDGSNWVQLEETDDVVTVEGTEFQVLVNGTFDTPVDGAVKLTLPQDIDPTSSPEFVDLTLSNGAIYDAVGNINLKLAAQASAVNYPILLNSATGEGVLYAVGGLDADIDLILLSKGVGSIDLVSRHLTTPVSILNGTFLLGNPQHQTDFVFSNTNAHRLVTFQDADGTLAFLSDIPSITTWVAYTPTFTGFGTVTNVQIWSKRVGDSLHIRGRFTGGTATMVEARMTLGYNGTNSNVTSSSTKITNIQLSGLGAYDAALNLTPTTLIESNVGYITFGFQSTTQAGLTKQLGTAFLGSGVSFSFTAEIPIDTWP